jgi:elongation of very long chain fatty acids protein 6
MIERKSRCHKMISSHLKIARGRQYTKNEFFVFGILYLAVVFILQKFMKGRKALELKWPLFTWNFAIGLFSLAGFLRTAPDLLHDLQRPNGIHESACIGTSYFLK